MDSQQLLLTNLDPFSTTPCSIFVLQSCDTVSHFDDGFISRILTKLQINELVPGPTRWANLLDSIWLTTVRFFPPLQSPACCGTVAPETHSTLPWDSTVLCRSICSVYNGDREVEGDGSSPL